MEALSKSQVALINEVKGSLFEFLVAQNLAEAFAIKEDFLASITSNHLQVLLSQQRVLVELDEDLLKNINDSAVQVSMEIKSQLNDREVTSVLLTGQGQAETNYAEADLILKMNDDEIAPISLKLSKGNSLVNTKSGGIKTFLVRYFDVFMPQESQELLNQLVDLSFIEFSKGIHHEYDIPYDEKFSAWKEQSKIVLPGQLSPNAKDYLSQYYLGLSQFLYDRFVEFYQSDLLSFKSKLAPLFGIGEKSIVQVIHFIDSKRTMILSYHDFQEQLTELEITKPIRGNSFFTIKLKECELQIRVKLMNKIFGRALKVNCSLKFY